MRTPRAESPRARGCSREALLEERIAKKNHPKLGAEPQVSYAGEGRREGAPGESRVQRSLEACGSGRQRGGLREPRRSERERGQGREEMQAPGRLAGRAPPGVRPGGPEI